MVNLKTYGGWRISALICWIALAAVPAQGATDEFIRGYVTAVLTEHFPAGVERIRVESGIIHLEGTTVSEAQKSEIRKLLSEVQGVRGIVFDRAETVTATSRADEDLPELLPEKLLFQPLLADPRWPHFSASYQRYLDSSDHLKDVAATSFGESFSIYRFRGPWDSIMEVGIQAGVFSVFDLDSESFDLINADYLVGIPLILEKSNFSQMLRIFHQSSHLGDEYLLRGNADKRINLSYEGVNTLLSYDLPAGFRIYVGGGYLFHRTPSELKPWSTQTGLEFRSPRTWLGGALRPVAAVDVENTQESDWNTELSIRSGVQFENPDFLSRKLLLLLEYYNGKSPNGQFYENNIEFFGIGVHLYF